MRSLEDISAVNGPHRTTLQAVRVARAEAQRRHPSHYAEQQKAHGDRVAARHAVNGQPFRDAGQQHINGFPVGRTLADRTAEHKAAGFAPGLGTEAEGH